MSAADHTYKFGVSMNCGGCSGAINRVLGKLDGMFRTLHLLSLPPLFLSTSLPPLLPFSPLRNTSKAHTLTTILSTHTGVKSYEVSLETQSATIITEPTLEYETVLKTIAKTGKKVNSGEADGEVRSVEVKAE